MGFLDSFLVYLFGVVMLAVAYLHLAESGVAIRFTSVPPVRSRFSTAVFRYVVERSDGRHACSNSSCSIICKLDRRDVLPCPMNALELRNLSENREHQLTLSFVTDEGERNSTTFSWFIDTIPPTATISSNQNYTVAEIVTVRVAFSEPCKRSGGFNCVNSSNCAVLVYGPAMVVPSSLRTGEDKTNITLDVSISQDISQGRVIISTVDRFCTDEAGNELVRTHDSNLVIHIDREPVLVDLWASIPSYALAINGILRTVYATKAISSTEIYLDFSVAVINSTEQIVNALHSSVGVLVPSRGNNRGSRRFVFKLTDVWGSHVVKIKLQASSIVCRTGRIVSSAQSLVFLLDSSKPAADVRTTVSPATKDSGINVMVGFDKPVFGFMPSMVDVEGGRVARFQELSRDLYSMTILAKESCKMVSVSVPEAQVTDISGNPNLASNRLELMHYYAPAVSLALQSFMTVGVITTSLTVALLSFSASNLAACAPGFCEGGIYPNPPVNLQGMVGHLQVFILSSWLSKNQPLEFSETMQGLWWLIPYEKLPWKTGHETPWPGDRWDASRWAELAAHGNNISIVALAHVPTPESGMLDISNRAAGYGSPLSSDEYIMYFMKGQPLSVTNRMHRSESNHWWEEMELNLLWVAIGGSLIIIHLLLLLLLRLRMGSRPRGLFSFPRFELLLLIIVLPGITQSSALTIHGGRIKGILVGALLLAIPVAFVSALCLFLAFMVFPSSFVLYKEIKHLRTQEPWHKWLSSFVVGPPALGKWFYRDGSPAFASWFGFLFEDLKGPALYVFADQNNDSTMPRWTESSDSGIGRMRAVSSTDSNEEVKIPTLRRMFGCVRCSYIVLDVSRRIILGFLAGTHSSRASTRTVCALSITMFQLVYLVMLKPYISLGVQAVESLSLLCEAAFFLLLTINTSRNVQDPPRPRFLGVMLLTLVLTCFVSQIIREWYAIAKFLLRLSQPQKGSLKPGLKNLAKGLVLPFLPRRMWSRVLSPDNDEPWGASTRVPCMEPLSSMTATVVPTQETWGTDASQGDVVGRLKRELRAERKGSAEAEPRSDLRRLREMAKASFSG
ncbi:hypothetical protein MLD38_013267 [Melastoma candidum]|uniref:Uncharacterized protein n=1 Tax=Melastoma candidum TaxID=119954 RepID=A0ACB9R950_9MYRT|nr:hypothetical protein MLD38_013267 [Melastoma candidum]